MVSISSWLFGSSQFYTKDCSDYQALGCVEGPEHRTGAPCREQSYKVGPGNKEYEPSVWVYKLV